MATKSKPDPHSAAQLQQRKQMLAEINQMQDDVRANALEAVRDKMPQKVVALHNTFITDPRFSYTGEQIIARYKERLCPETLAIFNETSECPHPTKKPRLAKPESGGSSTVPSSASSDLVIPCNQDVMDLQAELKKELLVMIETVCCVKLWIQLNIPRIEDGNNFGVDIQEDTVSELGRAEDNAYTAMEDIYKYHLARGKLVVKCQKYPHLSDYRMSIIELDRKEYINMRYAYRELRNTYAILHDLITKNMEKITTPRNSNRDHFF
ncbi:proteasome activator complex subunit 3 [Pelomyxa schiedti]|nr:proteasome activator complex subunit 3 [Pelomyxa schiedti]